MTTIAWDGKTMAADRQSTTNGRPHLSVRGKIRRINYHGRPALAGGCGTIVFSNAVIEWLDRGAPLDARPDMPDANNSFTVLVVTEEGGYVYCDSVHPVPVGRIPWALGSGHEYALGAMAAGASAKKAVEIACSLDVNSGMGIDTLTLKRTR